VGLLGRYEKNHWDAVIINFREIEHSRWSQQSTDILERLQEQVLEAAAVQAHFLPGVHILDLHAEGVIKPHVDSIKFSGEIVAGLSLM
jgi:alkylated DNA repair protein alkB family protein 7